MSRASSARDLTFVLTCAAALDSARAVTFVAIGNRDHRLWTRQRLSHASGAKWIVRNHFVISCFAFASRIRFVRLDKSSWNNVRRSVATTVVGNYMRSDSALRRETFEICQVDTFLWEFSTRHCRCNCEWNSVCYNQQTKPFSRYYSRDKNPLYPTVDKYISVVRSFASNLLK